MEWKISADWLTGEVIMMQEQDSSAKRWLYVLDIFFLNWAAHYYNTSDMEDGKLSHLEQSDAASRLITFSSGLLFEDMICHSTAR